MNNYKKINIYGTGRYVYLGPPDTQFDKDGIYHVTLEVPQDKAQEAIKEIDDVIGKEIAAAHKTKPNEKTVKRASTPYTNEGAIVTFKVKSKFKPLIVDRRNKELDPTIAIWKGTTLWAEVELRGYNLTMGVGCSLCITQIQIDNLVQGTANGVSHFPDRGESSSLPEKDLY